MLDICIVSLVISVLGITLKILRNYTEDHHRNSDTWKHKRSNELRKVLNVAKNIKDYV